MKLANWEVQTVTRGDHLMEVNYTVNIESTFQEFE